MRQSKVISDPAEFYKLLTNQSRKLSDWHILNEDMVQLEWEYASEFEPEDLTTNIFLRLSLHHMLEYDCTMLLCHIGIKTVQTAKSVNKTNSRHRVHFVQNICWHTLRTLCTKNLLAYMCWHNNYSYTEILNT